MVDFKTYIVNTIKNDATMQSYLSDGNGNINIFPVDVDIQPESFPCIIYQDAGISVISRPQGMHIGNFQMDIYSINNALEVETIYSRLAQLFNFKDSTTQSIPNSGILWWLREDMVRDTHDGERRIWRKMVSYKLWYSNADAS